MFVISTHFLSLSICDTALAANSVKVKCAMPLYNGTDTHKIKKGIGYNILQKISA
jgi:hypothetical protein